MAAIPYAILGYGRTRAELQRVIDATTHINVGQIRDGRAPLWWEDSARYRREMQTTLPGVERIQTAEELAAMGAGDCDDHAPALAASLQVAGCPARAVVIESPGIGYHVVVVARDRNGQMRVIDPSARRGMGSVGEESTETKRAKRKRRAHAAFSRALSLAKTAASMNPTAAATRGLLSEARRLAVLAQTDDEEDETETNADEGEEA